MAIREDKPSPALRTTWREEKGLSNAYESAEYGESSSRQTTHELTMNRFFLVSKRAWPLVRNACQARNPGQRDGGGHCKHLACSSVENLVLKEKSVR